MLLRKFYESLIMATISPDFSEIFGWSIWKYSIKYSSNMQIKLILRSVWFAFVFVFIFDLVLSSPTVRFLTDFMFHLQLTHILVLSKLVYPLLIKNLSDLLLRILRYQLKVYYVIVACPITVTLMFICVNMSRLNIFQCIFSIL